MSPIGANKRQIGANLAPIAHRQYIDANWRQLAPIGAQDLKFLITETNSSVAV